jgi:hypothetical protein
MADELSEDQYRAVCALNIVTPLLRKHNLRWVVTTGFACHVYGVPRPITDIDIDVDGSKDDPAFQSLIADLGAYISQPLKHYIDGRYDNWNFEATIEGQVLDVCSMAEMKVFDRTCNEYVPFYAAGFPDVENRSFCGIELPLMSRAMVIHNKRMLLEDLDMEPQYRDIHERDIAGLVVAAR